ncbi:uncharacterized protein LOC128548361 [Mercenaria mercenaria]|uniref:uncharacterized protein LOC128548361 n=1 Tax=Mercenaria mercenaria TaxID=6596 RepID=UPI00234E65FC|nr:uncharacterized protein LOC128548361 [Mercenaria mercenaria]
MASSLPMIQDKEFVNWLKGALALLFAKQGFDDFVSDEMTQFQKDMLASIFKKKALPAGTVCNSCTTENVLACPTPNFCSKGRCKLHDTGQSDKQPNQPCPNGLCQDMRESIRREHRYDGSSWKNTNASRWSNDAFEIAKCYMPPDGYSGVTRLADTDFNGTLTVIINNKRFQNKMSAQLSQPNNVCTKAREAGRDIRHSADLNISETMLVQYIDTLIDLLSDAKYLATDQNAKDAVEKLKQLKSNTLTITTADITTVLDNAIKDRQLDALKSIEKKTQSSIQLMQDVKALIADVKTLTVTSLDLIIAEKQSSIAEIKREAEKQKEEIAKTGEKEKERIEKDIKEDLIEFYRKHYSTISYAPLIEEHNVPLTDFYVQPPLTSVDIQTKFGQFQKLPKRTPIHSYRDVFLREDGELYKDVYVTANPGVGKTSFAKKVGMTWCKAHRSTEMLEQTFKSEDINMMKTFEFLFMVSLRDVSTSVCSLDDIIERNLLKYLARCSRYSRVVLEDILNERTCLVLLDGLDEWTHPISCDTGCRDVHATPHMPARKLCTVLTTTRPWKFDDVRLGTTQIDRHIEINELDRVSSEELISSAVKVLNSKTVQGESKTAKEFESTTSTLKLENLRYIPYILLQMICLWFDGKSIGKSKCEIYTNIIKLTLSRGLIKLGKAASAPRGISTSLNIPPCPHLSEICKSHYDVLIALAKLAFEKLFSSKLESNLVFDRSEVLCIISEDILQFCLEIGFLSQTKDYGSVSERRSTLSFQHKSIQEYFAALYIQSHYYNQDIKKIIRRECNTLSAILKMSNVFIFLAGLNSVACGHIFKIFMDNLSSDEKIEYFRNNYISGRSYLPRWLEYWEIMKSWQSMLTDSAQEIITNNGQNNTPLYIEDIIIDSTVTLDTCNILKILTENNKDKIKSISISECRSTEEFTEKLETLELQGMHSLLKLVIEAVPEEQDLYRLLSGSENTIACLILGYVVFRDNMYKRHIKEMSAKTVHIMLRMENLQTINLEHIRLRHADIEHLFQYLVTRQTMTYITLRNIICIDHEKCEGFCLDLSRHQNIKNFNLDDVPVSMLHVDSSSLEICGVGNLRPDVQTSLVQCLPEARNLSLVSFTCFKPEQFDIIKDTLPKLPRLESVAIQLTDLGDTALILSPQMTNLEFVYFYRVTMTSTSLRCLIDSVAVLPQHVKVELKRCTVKTEKDYRQMTKEIRSSPKYQVEVDELNESGDNKFLFYKLKDTT